MLKSGWIGFIRGDEFWESAAQLAKMGYQAMDSDASFVPGDGSLADKVKRLRDLGVEPLTVSAGFDPESLKNGLADLVAKCKAQNIMRVTMWGSSAISSFRKGYGNNGTYDELMKDIEASTMSSRAWPMRASSSPTTTTTKSSPCATATWPPSTTCWCSVTRA